MEEQNPIVLLSGQHWHIVEHSRRSDVGLCGQSIPEKRAHARLKKVGVENICPACAKYWRHHFEKPS